MTARTALLFALFLALVAAARADVITLTDGSTLEGKIVAETADFVEVKQRYGTMNPLCQGKRKMRCTACEGSGIVGTAVTAPVPAPAKPQ